MTLQDAYNMVQSCKASLFLDGQNISSALEIEGLMYVLDKLSLADFLEGYKKTLKSLSDNTKSLWGLSEESEQREAQKTLLFMRLLRLEKEPTALLFDADYLKLVHLGLYENILSDCGVLRNTNTSYKGHEHTIFEYIPKNLRTLLAQMEREKRPTIPKEQFAERLVFYFHELTILKPFREGDGIVTRYYLRQLARANGLELNLGQTNPYNLRYALDKAFTSDQFRDLYEILIKCLKYIPKSHKPKPEQTTPAS